MRQWSRREALKLGVLASTAAIAPKWAAASTERNLALNRAAWASSSANFTNTGHMSTDGLATTMWESANANFQWIYVDLGAQCNLHSVMLRWGKNYALSYTVQVSEDQGPSPETGLVANWIDVNTSLDGKGGVEQIPLPAINARYVRLLLNSKAKAGGYELTGFEVYGTGGFEPVLAPLPPPTADGTIELSGGWKLVNETAISHKAAAVSTCGYDDSHWLIATVPGTILTSYVNLGAVPNPFYGDYIYQISEFFAHTNWWYRNELDLPASFGGKRAWLNFDGINYRAFAFVNGKQAGSLDGAFIRGHFDVTELVKPGKKNCIAVLIMPVPKPGQVMPKRLSGYQWPPNYPKNEPTILAADSWDWLPTIPDRDTGIWNRVFLSTSGDVTVENPFVITHFPDTQNLKRADVTLKVDLKNHSSQPYKGDLKVSIGKIQLTCPVSIEAGEAKAIKLDKSNFKQLSLENPKLWWPNGHGEQNLYDLTIEFRSHGKIIGVHKSRVGIREFTYKPKAGTQWNASKLLNGLDLKDLKEKAVKEPLTFFCNGKRIFIRGVNWGMDEGMLRCDRRGFEDRVKMEKEMNFNLIRNWGGNLDKPEFFEVCDEYGLLVWEEFGIANGLMPDDPGMWLVNARDRFVRRRNHACIVLWCSANETMPDDPVLTDMPRMAQELDGTRMFLNSSIQVPPTNGDGPYNTQPAGFYFKDLARGFRPELGSPTIPTVESMRRMMPHNKLWPVNEIWGKHDWWLGINGGGMCGATQKAIAAYGAPTGIEDFCRKAQMVNMEVFKAIYEAWNDRMWNDCTGVMIWMSNPAWPSLTWNTYDYYKEPTAAYFACRKACEPIHIQWNAATNSVKVVNCTFHDLKGLNAEATIYNLDGSVFQTKPAHLDCPANSAAECMTLFDGKDDNLSYVHFIRLTLKSNSNELLSTNFYWRSKAEWKYESLQNMQQAHLSYNVRAMKGGKFTVDVANSSSAVALMIRFKLVDSATSMLLAPVLCSDNYFSLPPNESCRIEISLERVQARRAAKLIVEGWNIATSELVVDLHA